LTAVDAKIGRGSEKKVVVARGGEGLNCIQQSVFLKVKKVVFFVGRGIPIARRNSNDPSK